MSLADIRREYLGEPLDEAHSDTDPFAQFSAWFEQVRAVEADPTIDVTVDLEAVTVAWGDVIAEAGLPESARTALVSGEWDFLSQLLANDAAIGQTAGLIPYLNGFGSG